MAALTLLILLDSGDSMGGESGAAGTPSFRVTCQSGESRRGCLKGKLETPAALLYTRRGFPPALTLRELDALAKATSAPGEDNGELLALQIDAADFFEQNNNDTALAKCEGGIRSFCGLQGRDHFTLVTHRDALNLQSGMPASDGWVTMQSPGGQLKVTVDDYVRFLGAAAPDAAVCLADEVAGDANPNRVRKSAERAAEWTSKCLAARAAGAIPADTLLFAPAMGGVIDRERARAAKEVAVRGADGYALCGLGHWEAPAERAALVAASIAALADPARPRVLLGVGGPAEMLQATQPPARPLLRRLRPFPQRCAARGGPADGPASVGDRAWRRPRRDRLPLLGACPPRPPCPSRPRAPRAREMLLVPPP